MTQDVKKKAAAMHEATDIGTLIERVEAATGPDRELDVDIGLALGLVKTRRTLGMAGNWYDLMFYKGWAGPPPRWTGSVREAVRLVHDRRPGWAINGSGTLGIAWVAHPDGMSAGYEEAQAATMPLAILSALLRSLQENQT